MARVQKPENRKKSINRTQAAKEAMRRNLVNYSKVYYVELTDKNVAPKSILGPQGFKTWIQCYRFLTNFLKKYGIFSIKEIPKIAPNTWEFGNFKAEIKWMKVI